MSAPHGTRGRPEERPQIKSSSAHLRHSVAETAAPSDGEPHGMVSVSSWYILRMRSDNPTWPKRAAAKARRVAV